LSTAKKLRPYGGITTCVLVLILLLKFHELSCYQLHYLSPFKSA